MTHDPIRLLDDPSAHAALRRDLAVATRHRAPYDAAAGAARLEASLAKGTGAATAGWSGGALGFGALILGGLVTAGVWLATDRAATPEPPRAPVVGIRAASEPEPIVALEEVAPPASAVASTPVAPPVVAPPIEAVPEDMVEEAEVPTPPIAKPARARVATASRKKDPAPPAGEAGEAAAADYLREARSLQAARALLGRDAAQALARAQAGAAEFPKGAFAQEWEGVEILALFELGRRAEAEPRASRFLDRFPHGPYASQVRDALQRP